MTSTPIRTSAALVAGVLASLATVSASVTAAHAETTSRTDPSGDSRTYPGGTSSYDLKKVTVKHAGKITIKVDFYTNTSDQLEVYVDVPGKPASVDYVVSWSPISPKYVLVQTAAQSDGDDGFQCELKTGRQVKTEARMTIPRKCVGKPAELRAKALSYDDQAFRGRPTDRTGFTTFASRG